MSEQPFGPGVYASRLIRATIGDLEQLLDEALEAGGERRPGAGITILDGYMRASPHVAFIYGGVFSSNVETLERLLRTCKELAEAICAVFDTNWIVRVAPFVLERALGEAVMRICYILDPAVPPARTVVRMACYQLESIEGSLRAAEAFGTSATAEKKKALENISEMHAMFATNGFERTEAKTAPFTASLLFDGQRENLAFNATDAYKRYLPVSAWQWELGSGAVHARGWLLGGLVETVETEALTTLPQAVMAVAGSLLALADVLALSAASHTAVDADWFLRKNHLRRLGVTSWSSKHPDLAVGHVEYASRGPNWTRRSGYLGESFRKRED